MPVATNIYMYMQWPFWQKAKEKSTTEGKSWYIYALIGVALSTLSEEEKVKLRIKFDFTYFVAKEKLSFHK